MPKHTRPLVLLFVAIIVGYLWWYRDINHRADSTIESATTVSSTEHTPVKAFEPDVVTIATGGKETLSAAPSSDTPDEVVVRGQVKNRLERGIGGMQIEISPKVAPGWETKIYTASSDLSGEFLFNAIPLDDEYKLEVLASGGYAGTLLDPFPIDHDMSPVIITLESIELVSVDGMIVDTDFAPVADFEILVQNVGMVYPRREITSDSSGYFQLSGFPAGNIQISTSGDENFQITGIQLKPDQYRNLTIALDKGNYHLSGWVSSELGVPIAQARVVLTSDFSHQDYRSSSYRLQVTDSSGSFSFSELGGRGHRVVVDAVGYESRTFDYRFQVFSDQLNIQLQRK